MINKYGKSYLSIMKYKKNFLEENDALLKENDRISKIYQLQPKRTQCKICGEKISSLCKSFVHHDIKYFICGKCGHVNGEFLETNDFSEEVYRESDYGLAYREAGKEEYNARVKDIYVPKADFLFDCLKQGSDKDISALRFLDVGAGSGYFVNALNFSAGGLIAKGIEVSQSQVDYGNAMSGNRIIEQCDQKNIENIIVESDADVISFIGVLEHIINLHNVLQSINRNPNIKYIYFSVPLMSYSVVFEVMEEDVYNRLLGGSGAHTHLFSDDSIKYLCEMYGWSISGQWKFGTDMADMLRMIIVKLGQKGQEELSLLFEDSFKKILDELQLVIDKNGLPSEIHVVAEKRR